VHCGWPPNQVCSSGAHSNCRVPSVTLLTFLNPYRSVRINDGSAFRQCITCWHAAHDRQAIPAVHESDKHENRPMAKKNTKTCLRSSAAARKQRKLMQDTGSFISSRQSSTFRLIYINMHSEAVLLVIELVPVFLARLNYSLIYQEVL